MNVYLIRDGGDDQCWIAETMAEAVKQAEDKYIAECGDGLTELTDAEERAHYQDSMLESCNLIGELGNPPAPSRGGVRD